MPPPSTGPARGIADPAPWFGPEVASPTGTWHDLALAYLDRATAMLARHGLAARPSGVPAWPGGKFVPLKTFQEYVGNYFA